MQNVPVGYQASCIGDVQLAVNQATGALLLDLSNTMNATPLPSDAVGLLKDDGSGNLSWASISPLVVTSITVGAVTATTVGCTSIICTSVTASGLIYPQQHATAGAPAYAKGAIYFDTTLNKLRVGGAAAWETITSV